MWRYADPMEIACGASALSKSAMALQGRSPRLVALNEACRAALAVRVVEPAGVAVPGTGDATTDPDLYTSLELSGRHAVASPRLAIGMRAAAVDAFLRENAK